MAVDAAPVPGYPGYRATQDGRIWSDKSNRWLALHPAPNGYVRVGVYVGGRKLGTVHRMVALAWLPNPEGHATVNHKDGDKGNNRAANLEWCSQGDNWRHGRATGLIGVARGFALPQTKLSSEQVEAIRSATGVTQAALARQYGVSPGHISAIRAGKKRGKE